MRVDVLFSALCIARCCRCGATGFRALCEDCQRKAPLGTITEGGLPVVSASAYDEPSKTLITQLKYQGQTMHAAHLAAALSQVVPTGWREGTLVPMPLHDARLVERGFNQSALIARVIAGLLSMRLHCNLCERVRATQAQAKNSSIARRENMAGAFVVRKLPAKSRPAAVVLLDDVVTTGATMDAAARAFHSAGIAVLGGLSCALGGRDALYEASQKTVKASPPSSRSAGRERCTQE